MKHQILDLIINNDYMPTDLKDYIKDLVIVKMIGKYFKSEFVHRFEPINENAINLLNASKKKNLLTKWITEKQIKDQRVLIINDDYSYNDFISDFLGYINFNKAIGI